MKPQKMNACIAGAELLQELLLAEDVGQLAPERRGELIAFLSARALLRDERTRGRTRRTNSTTATTTTAARAAAATSPSVASRSPR